MKKIFIDLFIWIELNHFKARVTLRGDNLLLTINSLEVLIADLFEL